MVFGRTIGINPKFLDRLSDDQRKFILTATGLRFYDEFLVKHGKHLFIFGTTGGGKTQKGYAFVDWLNKLETQIWFDTGKTNEILPLLCMGRKVRIIIPAGTDIKIQERINGKWELIPDHPEVIKVNSPDEAISSIHKGKLKAPESGKYPHIGIREKTHITIISFRNSFSKKDYAISWVSEFFEHLAERCRLSTMPNIFPAAIHIDESQWTMAGRRVSGEGERSRSTEIITENALELRSARIRLVLYAQDYKNIPPAARENMLFNVLCKGSHVTPEENGNLAKWCRFSSWLNYIPRQYQVQHGRFVFENGDSYPLQTPWTFRLYPIDDKDRQWISGLRVRYEGANDKRIEDPVDELIPELGRYSHLAIPPSEREKIISKWDSINFGDQ